MNWVKEWKKYFTRSNILLGIAVVLPLALAFFPSLSTVVAIAIAVISLFLITKDAFYLIFIVTLFFYSQLVLPGGLALYRFFNYLLLIKIFFDYKKLSLNYFIIAPFFVIVIYCGTALIPNLGRLGVSTLADVILVLLLTGRILKDKALFRKFCMVFIASALVSGFYGVLGRHAFQYAADYRNGIWAVYVTRYLGSFVDPNYAGFFFNLALFMLFSLKTTVSWRVKLPIAAILCCFLIATVSLSSMICFFTTFILFAFLKWPRKAVPVVLALFLAVGGFYGAAKAIPFLSNIQIVSDLITRVDSQLGFIEEGDTARVTSERSETWSSYWEYFKTQTITKKLFGGNIVMASYLEPKFQKEMVGFPHQAYIGLLLNIGIIGTAVLLLGLLLKTVFYLLEYLKKREDVHLILITTTYMWIFFGMGIDFFVDWKFFFFYFL